MPFGSMFMKPPKMGPGMGGGMQQQKQMPGIGGAISPTQPPVQAGQMPQQMPDLTRRTGIRDPKTPYQTDPAPGTSREEMQQEYFRTGGKSGSLGGIISDEQMRGNRGNYNEMPQVINTGNPLPPGFDNPYAPNARAQREQYYNSNRGGGMIGRSINPSTSGAMRQMYQAHQQRQRMQGPMPNVDPDTQPRVVNGLHMSPVKPQPGMSYLQ